MIFQWTLMVHKHSQRPYPTLFVCETEPEAIIETVVPPQKKVEDNAIERMISFAGIPVIVRSYLSYCFFHLC